MKEGVTVSENPDELDLAHTISALWNGRALFAAIVAVITALIVVIAFVLPNVYRAEATLATTSNQGMSARGLTGDIGGLAKLAGLDLDGQGADQGQIAMATLQSRHFLIDFIHRREILVPLMAATDWESRTNQLILNPEIYDPDQKKWVRKVDVPLKPKPSDLEAYEAMRDRLSVTVDDKTNLVLLAVDHVSPFIAKEWADWLIADLNKEMSRQDAMEAARSVTFLRNQLSQTSIADIQNVFYGLIGEQMKTMMLAQAKPEYAFKIIDPPFVAEEPIRPNKILFAISGLMIGTMVAMVTVISFYLAGYRFRYHLIPSRTAEPSHQIA